MNEKKLVGKIISNNLSLCIENECHCKYNRQKKLREFLYF